MPGPTLPEPSMPNRHAWTERPFARETHHTVNYWKDLFACFHGGPNLLFQKHDFSWSGGPKWDPTVTFELKVREQNQLGFWNISIRPTSGASFIKIGRPAFSTPGTLSQTMTLNILVMTAIPITYVSTYLPIYLHAYRQRDILNCCILHGRELTNLDILRFNLKQYTLARGSRE